MFHAKIKKKLKSDDCMEAIVEQVPVKYNPKDKDTKDKDKNKTADLEVVHRNNTMFNAD